MTRDHSDPTTANLGRRQHKSDDQPRTSGGRQNIGTDDERERDELKSRSTASADHTTYVYTRRLLNVNE